MAAAILMSAPAFAQMGNGPQQLTPEQQKEMIQQRTDETVKEYGLNEDQAKQLLELNTKYADKMPMGFGRMGGRRGGGRPGGQGGPQGGFGGGAPQGGFGGGQMPQMTDEMRARMEEMRKQMTETREAYNKELEKIMTPEQYKKYTEAQQNRRGGFGGGPRGPRQQ